jgi:hypothetical protein
MTTVQQRTLVEDALLDVDGSCRDLNVDQSTWTGIRTLVDQLRRDFGNVTVGSTSHDTDDTQIGSIDQALDLVQSRGGSVQILLNADPAS